MPWRPDSAVTTDTSTARSHRRHLDGENHHPDVRGGRERRRGDGDDKGARRADRARARRARDEGRGGAVVGGKDVWSGGSACEEDGETDDWWRVR